MAYWHIRESKSYFNGMNLPFMKSLSGYFLLKYFVSPLSFSFCSFLVVLFLIHKVLLACLRKHWKSCLLTTSSPWIGLLRGNCGTLLVSYLFSSKKIRRFDDLPKPTMGIYGCGSLLVSYHFSSKKIRWFDDIANSTMHGYLNSCGTLLASLISF